MYHCEHSVKILVNLLQLTSIACFFDAKLFFYENKLLNMKKKFIAFVWLYSIYNIVCIVNNILYIKLYGIYNILYYILYRIYYIVY